MNEICSLKNIEIDKISFLFCSKCKTLIDNNSKICNNSKCSKVFCFKCSKNITCTICKKGQLEEMSMISPNLDNILFCCNKSKYCKGKYTYEEKIQDHSHKNMEIKECINCKKDINQTMNCLKCEKCDNFFCYKRLNYNPFIRTKEDFNENCGLKCFKCNKQFCSLCDKNKILCSYCTQNCSKDEEEKMNSSNKCHLCSKNEIWKVCSVCNNNICFACMNMCENNYCNNKICINCSLLCNICKKIICEKCSIKCSSCPVDKTLISCKNCDSSAIIKCSLKNCTNKICLNCLKYCNYCKEINCETHSVSCANCLETICPFHWHICKKCSSKEEDYSKKKLCLKNCTKKCHFCNYEINILCKEDNHPDNYVKKYSCGHYICNLCVKKCDICQEVIKACSECDNDTNYIYCRICDKYLCYYCSKKCTICEEHYCNEFHKCFLCGMVINNELCLNCDFIERNNCIICQKKLFECMKCKKIIICSNKCFLKHIQIKTKINKNFSRIKTSQSIKSNITNNVINNVFNLFQNEESEKISTNINHKIKGNKILIETEKGEHLCLMYYCEEHIGNDKGEKGMIQSNNLQDLDVRREDLYNNINKYKRFTNKENIKCSSCIIF